MIVRDIENTLTGRHVTQAERVAEGLRAVRALMAAGRHDDARRIARVLRDVVPDDPRTGALFDMVQSAEPEKVLDRDPVA